MAFRPEDMVHKMAEIVAKARIEIKNSKNIFYLSLLTSLFFFCY